MYLTLEWLAESYFLINVNNNIKRAWHIFYFKLVLYIMLENQVQC